MVPAGVFMPLQALALVFNVTAGLKLPNLSQNMLVWTGWRILITEEGSRTTRIGHVNQGKNQSKWIKVQ